MTQQFDEKDLKELKSISMKKAALLVAMFLAIGIPGGLGLSDLMQGIPLKIVAVIGLVAFVLCLRQHIKLERRNVEIRKRLKIGTIN